MVRSKHVWIVALVSCLACAGLVACESKTDDAEKKSGASTPEAEAERAAAAGAGEIGAATDEAPSGDDKAAKRARQKAANASMEAFATAFEEVVVANDVAAMQEMWASPDDLAGCVTREQDFQDGKMVAVDSEETWADEVARNRGGMDNEWETLKTLEHGERFRHRTHVWRNAGPNEAFGGAACAIEFHGEVWFDGLVTNHPKGWDGVRHRAHFAMVGEDWRLLDYIGPQKFICANAADKNAAPCKKLRGEDVEE